MNLPAAWRCLLALLAGLLFAQAAWAQGDDLSLERKVKAAFLYKFLGYIEWPPGSFAQPDSPVVIAVSGADEVAVELQQIVRGRNADNHPIVVRRLAPGEAPAGIHLLFAGGSDKARIAALLKPLLARPVLLATETEGALALGSAINFLVVDGRVRFEVAAAAAERNGVKLSSRLLSLAYKPGAP